MITLYVDRSPTTMNDTIIVLDFGSSPNMIGIVVAPKGETESPVNPVKIDVKEIRSLSVSPNFWKASRYMSAELPVSIMTLVTQAFAIRVKITRASSWSRYSSFPDPKVMSRSSSCFGLLPTAVCAGHLSAECCDVFGKAQWSAPSLPAPESNE
ncbi:hypothetical protein GW17_00030583 [Ensete ventricosum]|nr:hypothetical protein GW17_00030583 [Ensete ventricosum]